MDTSCYTLKRPRLEQGASLLEYALLTSLIAIAVIGAINAVADQVNASFEKAEKGMGGGAVDSLPPG